MASPSDDPFDSLLTLEDTLYTTAYTSGVTVGSHTGRTEGRIFGLSNGFDKFAALGHLHGRSVVWGARIGSLQANSSSSTTTQGSTPDSTSTPETKTLPLLKESARLKNNTTLLHSLTDPLTFDTANTEEAVADFDDRVKRAGAKAKVIERIVGESEGVASAALSPEGSPARRGKSSGPVRVMGEGGRKKGSGKGDDSMEDFAGSRVLR